MFVETVKSFLTTALYTFASLLSAPSISPDTTTLPPIVARPTIAAVAAFTSPVMSVSPPIVASCITVNSSAFKSSKLPSHLLAVLPIDSVPFVVGSIAVFTNAFNFISSVPIASPITVLPFNVVCPSTVTSESNCALFVTFILSLNTALAVTVSKSLFALPIVALAVVVISPSIFVLELTSKLVP